MKNGSSSLRFVTDSGFDCGVRYVVPGGAHWDLRGVRFLTFWSFGSGAEGYQGEQPVVVLRGPGGSIRFTPPSAQTVNGEWRFHRVPLGDTSDWLVTTEGSPSLGDITTFEIHQDPGGMGLTVFYDSVTFASDIPEDLAEGTAALWGTFASDSATTSVADDQGMTRSGTSALRFDTASGSDTGLVFPKWASVRWNLSDARSLSFWIRAENANAFQGSQPIVVLRSPSGTIRLEPGDVLLGASGWRFFEVPLDGSFPWTRTQTGTPDLSNVEAIEIHADTGGYGFRLYVDGVSIGRPLPLVVLPSASTPAGHVVTAALHLSEAAPAGGRSVQLSSSDPFVVSVPATVVVPEGARSATFPVTAGTVASATEITLTATDRGYDARATLRVDPVADVASVTIVPATIVGGLSASGAVTLAVPARAGGVVVLLTSSLPSAASVPPSVTVVAGATTAAFAVTTSPVSSDAPVTITANAGGAAASATLTVLPAPPPAISSLVLSPSTLLSGASASLTLTLAAPAPAGGAVVALTASPSGLVSFPATVTVPEGTTTAAASVVVPAGTAPAVITLTATVGSSTRSSDLTIAPPSGLLSVSVSPASITAGNWTTVTVALTSAAPWGGKTISLASSDPRALALPASVTIPEGVSSTSITPIAPSDAPDAVVTITASEGSTQRTTTLTVLPVARISRISFAASGGFLGESVTGTVTLDSAAPIGGYTVTLASSLPESVSVPASVVVPAGSLSATFQAVIAASGPGGYALISASRHGVTLSTSVGVVAFSSVSVSPSPAPPGAAVFVQVNLSAVVPTGRVVDVSLASSAPGVLSVPSTAQLASGTSTKAVPAVRADVAADTPVEVTVTALGVVKTYTVVVEPLKVAGIVSRGGNTAVDACREDTLRIRTNGTAPAEGATILVSVENGYPQEGTRVSGSSPDTFAFALPAGSSTLDVRTLASWGTEPRQLVATAHLGASEASTSMGIRAGKISASATPSEAPRGSTIRVQLWPSGNPFCASVSDFEAQAASSEPTIVPVPAVVRFVGYPSTGNVLYWYAQIPVPSSAPSGVARLTFTAFGTTASVDVTVPEAALSAFSVIPNTAPAGAVVTGTVLLDTPAPVGGTQVTLASSDPSRVSIPSAVIVSAGAATETFPISLSGPPADSVTITATYLGNTRTVAVKVLSEGAGRVSGRIVDESWWDYVPGLGDVAIKDASGWILTTSAADGTFSAWREPGTGSITFERAGFVARTAGPFEVAARGSTDLGAVGMEKHIVGGCQVRGRVVDVAGQPVAGASLKLVGYDLSLTTGGDGGFTFNGELLDRYRFRAAKEGLATIVHDIHWGELFGSCTPPAYLDLLDLTLPQEDLPELTAFWAFPPVLEVGESATVRGRLSWVVPPYDGQGTWLDLSSNISGSGYQAGPTVTVDLSGVSEFHLYPPWWMALRNLNSTGTPFTLQHAFFYGGVSKTATVTFLPAGQKAFYISCSPPMLKGGSGTRCAVYIGSDVAPAGGLTVALASSSAIATVPETVAIQTGENSASFNVWGTSVALLTPVTITATDGARTTSAVVEVAPPALSSLSVTPSRVSAGGQAEGTAALDFAAAADGVIVALSASSPAVTVPANVTIPAGSRSAPFVVTVSSSAPTGLVTLRATAAGHSRTRTIDIGPPRVAAVTVSPDSVQAGLSTTGSVLLDVAAPSGDCTVSLASSDPATVQVPATIQVPAGAIQATFPVTTSGVAATRSVTLTASANGSSAMATLEVRVAPPTLFGAAPGVALPGASGITVYGTGLGAATSVLLSGPVYPLGSTTATCNIRGAQGPFCPEVVVTATPSSDGKSLEFSLPSNAATGTYLLEARAGSLLSANGVPFLVEQAAPAFEAVAPEDHKIAQRIYPGQTVEGILTGTAPNCPYGATDYNQYFFVATAGSRINVRMERVDTSVPWSDPSSLDPQVEVVAPDGFIYGNLARFNDKPGVDFNATIADAYLPRTGLYVILAETARGSGAYRLSFSFSSLAPAPVEGRVIPVAGNHVTGHVGDVVTSWAQILDPTGQPLSGASTTFQVAAEPGDSGTVQFTSGASTTSSSIGVAAVRATLASYGRVRFTPVMQQTLVAPAGTVDGAPALTARVGSGERIPIYPAVAMRPFSVGRFDGDSLDVESSRFERFPLAPRATRSSPVEESASGKNVRGLGSDARASAAPQPYGPEVEALGQVPPARFEEPGLATTTCQDDLRFHAFAVLPSAQIHAPLSVSLEDLTPSTGESTANGPVGEEGIHGHRIEKEIRLRIMVRDANGNEPDYPVLVSVSVGGRAAGTVILDPDGARIECPTATFVWHQRDESGTMVAPNEIVGYRLGTLSSFLGVDTGLKPVWNWTELFEVETFTPGQEEPSVQVFGVHPEPGKPDRIFCRDFFGQLCGDSFSYWAGYKAYQYGLKQDGTPRLETNFFTTLNAYTLVDKYENTVYGYHDTSISDGAPSTDVEFVAQVPGETSPDQPANYKIRTKWNNDPAWPNGTYPATLSVRYPIDPDWPAGEVTRSISLSFEAGVSRALSKYLTYDLIRPDGTRGIDDGAFPIRAYSKATSGVLPKTEAGDGVRLVLVAYRGEVVPGELPYPEPTETGLRMWQAEGDHWRVAATRTTSFLETAGPSAFRFTLIDHDWNVVEDGGFVVHRCPRFDHSAPGAGRPCDLVAVASVNGRVENLLLNPSGPGANDSRGYLGIELTRAPEGLGAFYVRVESITHEYRLRRQADFVTNEQTADGEFQGAFKLVDVADYPCPDGRCGQGACNSCTGSPNYVASGTYTTSATDLVVPTSGPTIAISRNYLSTPGPDGVVGPGWTSSLDARVYLAPYLSGGIRLGTEANVVLPSGLRYKFRLNPVTGHFDSLPGRRDDLVRNADGTFDLFLERGSGAVYRFDKHGLLVSETDEYGNVVAWERDAQGRVSRIADSSGTGRWLAVGWTSGGKVHTLTDSASRTVIYDYDAQGRLAGVTDPAGRRTQHDYRRGRDSTALLTRVSDPWGRALTDVSYDSVDRTASYTEQGTSYTYTYADSTHSSKADDAGRTTSFTFDPASGVITTRTSADDAFSKVVDSEGRPVHVADAEGVVTEYSYDDEGHVLTVTRNAGQTGTVRYDYAYDPTFPDKVASVTPKSPATNALDPAWQGWRYEYHPTGSTRPGGLKTVYRVANDGTTADAVSRYEYDAQGRVTRQTTAGGAQTDYGYDNLGNLQTVTGPAGSTGRPVTIYEHDALGRVTDVTDPLGKVTHYTYDALGRVLTVTLPPTGGRTFTTTYTYDHYDGATGFLYTEITDPNGRLTRLGYDADGRLRRSVDASGGATLYGYTGKHLTTITDPNGNVTTYGYDAGGRLASTAFPDGGQETYTYWNDGLLRTKTDRRGTVVTYTYDAFKRLLTKSYSTGGTVTYAYDGQKLLTVTDTTVTPAETHSFGYDNRYRLSSAAQAGRGTLGYTYTADDRVETLTLPSGPTATHAYYTDGSLHTLQWSPVSGAFTWDYTARGQYDTLTFPNGQIRDYAYDDQGRLTSLTNALGAATLAGYAYGYDVDPQTGQPTLLGQRTSQTATLPAQGLAAAVTRYGYDPLYQLTRAEYPSAAPFNSEVHTWSYDSIGNRTTQGIGASVQTYTYLKAPGNPLNGQKLQGDGVDAMTYDPAGNLATRQGPAGNFIFGYDPENRLKTITGAETATYTYDYQGRRTSKTVGGVTTTYLYDGLNLVSETTGGQTTYFLNGPGIDEPLAMSKSGAVSYFSVDGLGSVVATNDPTGTVTHSVAFDAWGNVKAETGTRGHPFTYTGRETGEAGFHFYRARFYQPGVGRFSQEDPLALPPSMTRYAYAINDPANFYDPNGQSAVGVLTRFVAVDLVTPDPTDVAIGPKIAFYATAVAGAIFIDYVFERSRAHSDPVRVPAWVDVGRDCQGRCRPCPTPPSPWQHPGNEHGSTSGTHWHWIEWHQDPSNCRCYSTRRDGPTAP